MSAEEDAANSGPLVRSCLAYRRGRRRLFRFGSGRGGYR